MTSGLQAAARAANNAIYLGKGDCAWAWAGKERPTLLLGPTRSGKTSCIIIPNVLAAPGAVVSTSTKPDVMDATARARSCVGHPLLYDPTGTVPDAPGVTRVGWSPVNAAKEWDDALAMARAMVYSARPTSHFDDHHWSERANALLSTLLHAAALADQPMSAVLSWVNRHHGQQALALLTDRYGDQHASTDSLFGILTTHEREQSSIWSTTSGVLSAYRSSAGLSSTKGSFLDAEAFCDRANTLYICAPGRDQQLVAPLIVGMLSEIRDAAYRRAQAASESPAGSFPAPAPVLLALDEVAHIAPLPDLPSVITQGAGQGLLTLTCLQDLSQARARWGEEAKAFLSHFGCTVVLPGIADMSTLTALSELAGDVELLTRTTGTSQGSDGRLHPSVSVSGIFRRRLSVADIAWGRAGHALAFDSRMRPGWIELTPSYEIEPWCSVATPRLQRERHRNVRGFRREL